MNTTLTLDIHPVLFVFVMVFAGWLVWRATQHEDE